MNRKTKKEIKVLTALVIAIAMIGLPATIFSEAGDEGTQGTYPQRYEKPDWLRNPDGRNWMDKGEGEIPRPLFFPIMDEEFDGWSETGTPPITDIVNGDWTVQDFAMDGPYTFFWDNLWSIYGPGNEDAGGGVLSGYWQPGAPGSGSTLPGGDMAASAYHDGFTGDPFGLGLVATLDFAISPRLTRLKDMQISFDYQLIPDPYAGWTNLEVWIITHAAFDPLDENSVLLIWDAQNGFPTAGYDLAGTYGQSGWTTAYLTTAMQTFVAEGSDFYVVFKKETPIATGAEETWIDNFNITVSAEHDVDVTALVKPDPKKPHATTPTEIWANVTNVGENDEVDIDLHLQIYEEIDFQPEVDWYDNMESCCVNWTVTDASDQGLKPGDGLSWTRSDRRYVSPTHSWRSTGCDRGTYASNSYDTLTSKVLTIPDWEKKVWLNFSLWVQGEIGSTGDGYKYEDYLKLGIYVWNTTTSVWDYFIIDKYASTGKNIPDLEEWMYPEQMEDGLERLNLFGADYDQWVCEKGSGAPVVYWGGIDLDPYLNYSVAGKKIMIEFVWVSDPCNNFEGAYIDDVKLLSQRGPLQPLVMQGYKFLGELESGETKLVTFPLEYELMHDTTYFIEIYSNLENDTDGIGEINGSWRYKYVPGQEDPVRYWDPDNGVNESVYIGDIHDGEVLWIIVPDEKEIVSRQCDPEGYAEVPIQIRVHNNGTIEEDIPVTASANLKIEQELWFEGYEAYEVGDNLEDIGYYQFYYSGYKPGPYWQVDDRDAYAGEKSWHWPATELFVPAAEGGAQRPMSSAAISEKDIDLTGASDAYYRYNAKWSFSDKYGPNLNYHGEPETDACYLWIDGTVYFGPGPGIASDRDWYVITGHSNGEWLGPANTGGKVAKDGYELFNIDLMRILDRYGDPAVGYIVNNEFRIGWLAELNTLELFNPDCPELFSGIYFDNMQVIATFPGPTVWKETKIVHLAPCEEETVDFTWNASEYCFYIIKGETELEGDCNPLNDNATAPTYIYHQAYWDHLEEERLIKRNWETEDNTAKPVPASSQVCDNGLCDWALNHYFHFGDLEMNEYPLNADIVMQMVNTSNEEDGAFNLTAADDLTLEFDLWIETETDWDYLTFEVSNNSGQDWWTVDAWSNVINTTQNEEYWMHMGPYILFNHSAGLDYIYAWGEAEYYAYPWSGLPGLSYTKLIAPNDQMHFRFHFLSDGSTVYKGVYIDNVYLNKSYNTTYPWNGNDKNWEWINEPIFHDDFEDMALTDEQWIKYESAPEGDLWHISTHSPLDIEKPHKWACFDEKGYSSYNKYLLPMNLTYMVPGGTGFNTTYSYPAGIGWNTTENYPEGTPWNDTSGAPAIPPLTTDYYLEADVTLTADVETPADENLIEYYNASMTYRKNMENNLTLKVDLSDKFQAFVMYYQNFSFSDIKDYGTLLISTDGGNTWEAIGGTSGTHADWHMVKVDISRYLPAVVMLRWMFISNETQGEPGDFGWEIDFINITAKPDCKAPVTACILNPPTPDGQNGWYVTPVEVTLTATDNKEVSAIYYSIDGGSWLTYTDPFTISVDGEHTISYYAVDHVGNAEEPKSCSFKIDTTAPTASITKPQAGYIYLFNRELLPRILVRDSALIIGGLTATATASDATSGVDYVTFSTGAGTGEDAVSPYEFNLPFYFPFGSDTLTVSATDEAGNTGADGSVAYTKIL
jgi:hypothetical protein